MWYRNIASTLLHHVTSKQLFSTLSNGIYMGTRALYSFLKQIISFCIFRPLFSIIYQIIYDVFICFLSLFKIGKEKQGQGKKSNPWIFSFPILKKARQKIKTEGRSGKNDKHSCQLLYGTAVNNWAKKENI